MNWKEELKKLSLINRQVMQVHTFFIALVVFLMGALCLFASEDLTSTRLGKVISLGLGIFWFIRLIFQFFAYSPKIWKGKTFESIIHILASVFWTYLTIVFFMNYFSV